MRNARGPVPSGSITGVLYRSQPFHRLQYRIEPFQGSQSSKRSTASLFYRMGAFQLFQQFHRFAPFQSFNGKVRLTFNAAALRSRVTPHTCLCCSIHGAWFRNCENVISIAGQRERPEHRGHRERYRPWRLYFVFSVELARDRFEHAS
jgi:hypothetical protein